MRFQTLFVLQQLSLVSTLCASLLHRRDLRENWIGDVELSTSYTSLREIKHSLHNIETFDTKTFSASIIYPDSKSSSTQIAYNCTSTSALWNLQKDANVLRLETFEEMSGDIVATVTIHVADCSSTLSPVNRVVIGNKFFGSEISSSPVYFYVVNASKITDTMESALESCKMRLQLTHATFAQVYPDCKLKFRSTDITNLIQTESHEATEWQTRRNLKANSFGFEKHFSCQYNCGEESEEGEIEAGKCWAKVAGKWTKMQCKVEFYEKNSKCSSECGYEGDNETLPPSQCYECSDSDSCTSSFSLINDGCCRVLECEAVEKAAIGTLSWNLDDTLAVNSSSYPIFESGDCSDIFDPLTNCCRITCENCFFNVSIASLFADIEIVGMSFDEAIEMELTGNSNLEVALFAPNGCSLDETTQLQNVSFTIPLGQTGISIDISMALDLHRKISLQPHGTTAFVGASVELETLTAGSLRSETFSDIQISSKTSTKLAQSGIDLEMELELIPTFKASLSLLKGLAQIGVKIEFVVFVELNSTFQFPEPFPGLSSEYIDKSSLWHGGDCRLPHFMEYNCNAGYGEVNISIPLIVKLPILGNKTTELDIVSSSGRKSVSLFSGCVATSYEAEIILLTAINTVSSLTEEKKEALQSILLWTLEMTDLDLIFVSVSSSTGEICIKLSVPPSLGEVYTNASVLATEIYRRVRNESFAKIITNFVGLDIAAYRGDNWWGVECSESCNADHCKSVSCNSADGTILVCGSCEIGYWGSICENSCELPDGCTGASCRQRDGGEINCVVGEDRGRTSGLDAVFSIENNFIVLGLFLWAQLVNLEK